MNILHRHNEINKTLEYLKSTILSLILSYILILVSCSNADDIRITISKYPDGKDFAFTITEDPDYSKMEDRIALYNLIDELGFKTTIALWVLDNKHGSGLKGGRTNTRGMTTTNASYLKHLKDMQNKGFEICLHTVGPGNDLREETIKGYELFKKQFGHYPKININHANNIENIYWGKDRFSNPLLKAIYGFKSQGFEGHIKGSKYFWGDICKEKTKYVRGWATDNINTLSVNKTMPYHLYDKPFVNWWFGCSDGYRCDKFVKLVSDSNIKRLVSERGTSIIYTHFAYGFVDKQRNINEHFKQQLTKISKLNGWFVPASAILDRFLLIRNIHVVYNDKTAFIINNNDVVVEKLTILTNKKKLLLYNTKEWKSTNEQGEIIIGSLLPHSVIILGIHEEKKKFSPGLFERVSIIRDWILGRNK